MTKEPLTITAVANDQGHLFKAIHAEDITAAAKARGLDIPKEYVVIESPIKAVGEAQIVLKSQGKTFL